MMRHLTRAVVLATALLLAARAPGGDLPIVTSDLLRLRTVSAIDVARDGSRAVYAVRSISPDEVPAPDAADGPGAAAAAPAYTYRSHLFLLDLFDAQSAPRQLTFGPRVDSAPAISPDGRRVAFVRRGESVAPPREGSSDAQVWVMDLGGGEARQVTNLEHGASDPRWSPDGSRLLVHSTIPAGEISGAPPWPTERPGRRWNDLGEPAPAPAPDGSRAEIRAWLEANAAGFDPLVITRIEFQDELELRREMTFTHLFIVDLEAGEGAAPLQVTRGFADHEGGRFLADGRVVYCSQRHAPLHPDRVLERSLWTVGPGGGDDELLLSLEGWRLDAPQPSPDGSVLAFTGQRIDQPAFRPEQIGLIALGADAPAPPLWVTEAPAFDGSARDPAWLPARNALLFTTAQGGGFPLMTVSQGLLEPEPLVESADGFPAGVGAFAAGGGAIVYARTTPAQPCALRVIDARGDRLVDDLNPWVAQRRLSMPREGWVERPDGTRVQYWVMEPTERRNDRTYPLALEIHGGPSVMWGPGELSMWHEFQLLCSWGYGVVYANPRGSGGYGYDFQRANFQDWGEGPAGDVLAALDRVVAEGWADPRRLAVTGGSYAGYLTAWIVAHDQRFAAAVAQRGVYDLQTFFGEGNAWRLVDWAMGGHPWDPRAAEVLRRQSPFTHADQIRTPLLIMHASSDLRTGVAQSEMLYRALKHLERPVEYIRYPGAGHDLSRSGDPRQRMDRLNRIIEFFERFVQNPRPAPQLERDAATAASAGMAE